MGQSLAAWSKNKEKHKCVSDLIYFTAVKMQIDCSDEKQIRCGCSPAI